jgi:thiamine pyrophosphokinase
MVVLLGHGRESSIGPVSGKTALILAGGDAPSRSELDRAWPGWDTDIDLVIAADGGARHAAGLGVRIDIWIGDGDSTDPAVLRTMTERGMEIHSAPAAKDESDAELAVRFALDRGAAGIVIVGGTGGPRMDHALANIGLLAMPELIGRDAALLDSGARIRRVRGPGTMELSGAPGNLVSLLPDGGPALDVTTDGLVYPLRGEPLLPGPPRGLSNVIERTPASVRIGSGSLLVIESAATIDG